MPNDHRDLREPRPTGYLFQVKNTVLGLPITFPPFSGIELLPTRIHEPRIPLRLHTSRIPPFPVATSVKCFGGAGSFDNEINPFDITNVYPNGLSGIVPREALKQGPSRSGPTADPGAKRHQPPRSPIAS